MQTFPGIDLSDVQAVYDGAEGDLWELVMGEQIHIGGLSSSMELADRAGIADGSTGVDLCCCNGAGRRFLVRFRGVAHMTGVDATERIVEPTSAEPSKYVDPLAPPIAAQFAPLLSQRCQANVKVGAGVPVHQPPQGTGRGAPSPPSDGSSARWWVG